MAPSEIIIQRDEITFSRTTQVVVFNDFLLAHLPVIGQYASFRSSLVLNVYVFPLLAVYVILSVVSCLMPRPIVSLLGTWLPGAWLRQGMREVISSMWSLPQRLMSNNDLTWRSHPTGNRFAQYCTNQAYHWLPYPVKGGQISDWRENSAKKCDSIEYNLYLCHMPTNTYSVMLQHQVKWKFWHMQVFANKCLSRTCIYNK